MAQLQTNYHGVRESDSGARMLRIVHHVYISRLRWRVAVHPAVEVVESEAGAAEAGDDALSVEASAHYLESLSAQLEAAIAGARQDILSQCKKSFAHGTLLALRYTIEDMDWRAAARTAEGAERVRGVMRRVMAALRELMAIALATLTDPMAMGINVNDELEDGDPAFDAQPGDDAGEQGGQFTGHAGQVLTVGCWLTVKEIGLVVGTMARTLPLPAGGDSGAGGGAGKSFDPLEEETVEQAGAMLLECMLTCKHNGAVEKCQVGFHALAHALLHSDQPRLGALPRQWLSALLDRLTAPGQGRDDIARRSSGLPLACVALFTAEPVTSPKGLLAAGMEVLLDVADIRAAPGKWEVWNQVHAFNVLRTTFQSRDLSMHGSAYSSRGLILSIQAMSSPSWEVRNSAALAFTELITRTLGFKNNLSGDSARRAVTGLEFFHRYPTLHPFLLAELQTATEELLRPAAASRGGALPVAPTNRVHPSLYPILVLLSRLRPSMVATSAASSESLSPAAFISAVQPCANARLLAVRHLAAEAFAPLVAPDDLPACVSALADLLPTSPDKVGREAKLNALHGHTLMMYHLLRANAASSPGSVRAALVAILPRLAATGWMLSEACPADTLREDLLQLHSFAMQFLAQHEVAEQAEHANALRAAVRAACRGAAGGGELRAALSPSAPIMQKAAARLYFGRAMAAADDGPFAGGALSEAELAAALHSPSYEVRAGALKGLLEVGAEEAGLAVLRGAPFLRDALLGAASRDAHFKVVERALRVLVLLPAHEADVAVFARLLQSHRHPDVRMAATHCLGKALGRMVQAQLLAAEGATGAPPALADLQAYVARLRELALPTQTCDARLCAAAGLAASSSLLLVAHPHESVVALSLQAWRVALTLMEDEDEEVRQAALMAARGAAAEMSPSCTTPESQVELVIRQVLRLLASVASRSPALAELLLEWVCPELAARASGAADGGPIIQETLGSNAVQRLFDKELDNQHEEPLLLSQGAALHLCAILTGGQATAAAAEAATPTWALRAAAELAGAADFLRADGGGTWAGGPANHPDVFRLLYQLLLGLRAAARCGAPGDWAPQVAQQLGAAVEPLAELCLQPALGNLLADTLLLWEKRCAVDLKSMLVVDALGDCFDPDFDAFYLITG
eukprot:jgi/Tetstr1/448987/TSEL_036212.t1